MPDRSIRVRFVADVQSLRAGMQQAGRDVAEFGRNLTGHGTATREEMERVGRSALLMSAGIGAGLGLAAKAAIDWESAWAGVTKTVDGTDAQLGELEQGLRDLAKELPASHAEIAAVAEAAGQLGVQRENIESFTKTMIDLGETTNLSADEAATAIARMTNVMQTAPQDVDRLGSALVALGNEGASTEREIVEMGQRIAGAGQQIGLSEDQVLAFANALSSVGVEVEAGGTAISRTFIDISKAVADGGADLDKFAQVAGMSGREFASLFKRDAAGAVITFIEGLDRMSRSGENVFAVLEQLGVTEQRQRNALLLAAGAGDLFRESLETGARAWEENTALVIEAEKRYATTGAKLEMLRNQVTDLAIDVGDELLPALSGAADVLGTMVQGFQGLPSGANTAVAAVGAVSAGFLGLIGVLGIVGPKIAAAQEALRKMGAAGQFVDRNLGSIGKVMAGAAIGVGLLSYALGENEKRQREAAQRASEYTDAIIEQGAAVGDLTGKLAAQALVEGDLGQKLLDADADLRTLSDTLQGHTDQVDKLGSVYADMWRQGFDGMDALRAALREAGLEGTAFGDELVRIAEAADLSESEISSLIGRLDTQAEAYGRGKTEAEKKKAADDAVGDAAQTAGSKVDGFTGDIQDNEAALEEAKAAAERWREGVERAFAPLEAQANLDQFTKSVNAIGDTLDDARERVAEIRGRIADAQDDLVQARKMDPGADRTDAIESAQARILELQAELQEALGDTSNALDGNSEAALRNRDMLLTATRDATDAIEAAAADEQTTYAELAAMRDTAIAKIEAEAESVGMSKDQVKLYTDALRKIPLGELNTQVRLDIEDAQRKLDRYLDTWLAVIQVSGSGIDAAQAEKFVNRAAQDAAGHATGGFLDPGWNLVGEAGPELIGPDRRVYPAAQTAQMMGDWSTTSTQTSTTFAPALSVQVLPTEDPYKKAQRELRKLAAASGF